MQKFMSPFIQKSFGQVFVMYSTPTLYVNYLHKLNETWPQKTDDFLPYADHLFSYWTGYFTSRPNFKVGYAVVWLEKWEREREREEREREAREKKRGREGGRLRERERENGVSNLERESFFLRDM